MQATLAQLVFGRDTILNTQFEANWKYLKERKQKLIEQNNKCKNKKRDVHEYHVQDLVLYRIPIKQKYSETKWTRPYPLVKVYNKGTVLLRQGAVEERVNIRNIKPYFI